MVAVKLRHFSALRFIQRQPYSGGLCSNSSFSSTPGLFVLSSSSLLSLSFLVPGSIYGLTMSMVGIA